MENNNRYYIRLNEESQSAMLQRHYGSFFRTVNDAMASAERYLGRGDVVEVVDEQGNVYLTTGLMASET